jgi:uncharacterized protein
VRPRARGAFLFFAALLLLLLPDVLAQGSSRMLGLAWSELFAMLLPAWIAAEGRNLKAARYLGFVRPRPLPVFLGALLGAAGFVAATGLAGLWILALPRRLVEWLPDVARIFEGSPALQVVVTAVAVVLAPICEEAAFRGYLQRTLARALGPWTAIGLAALLFALRHVDPVRFLPLVFLGALFGWLAWRSGSLWPAIAAHAANNAIAAALTLTGSGSEAVEAVPTVREALVPLLAGGAALAVLAFLYLRATPAPPPPDAAVEPRDPARPWDRFRPDLVPEWLTAAAIAGLAALLALALGAAVWDGLAGP